MPEQTTKTDDTPAAGTTTPEIVITDEAALAAGPGSPEHDAALAAATAAAEAKKAEGDEEASAADKAKAAADKAKAEADVSLTLDAADPAKVTVDETGHAEFDAVGKLLGDSGIAEANEIMSDFLETGEVSLEHKAKMIETLGESVANLAFKQLETAATEIISEAREDTRKSMDYANEKFNGADAKTTWDQIKEYVRTPEAGFSEADLATMNTMLAAGGLQAQLVIDKVHTVYMADKNVSVPGTLLEGDAGSNGVTFEPISRIDYSAEMGKAVSKYGEDSFQVRELNRRRTMTMKMGN